MRPLMGRRGDTLIEVMFSITVFAIIAVISVGLMNGGVRTAQRTLEVSMARNEIAAQAEALRYIHDNYVTEKALPGSNRGFTELWERLTGNVAQIPDVFDGFSINNVSSCGEVYASAGAGPNSIFRYDAFVMNTRLIQPSYLSGDLGIGASEMIVNNVDGGSRLQETALYPRIIYSESGNLDGAGGNTGNGELRERSSYRKIAGAQGIWIVAVRGGENAMYPPYEPEFFDFHIQTCWHSVGGIAPSTIDSIVRLYNPDWINV